MKLLKVSLTLLLMAVALPACTGNITDDNYVMIKPGMSYDEVVEVLGEPTDEVTSEVTTDSVSMGKYGRIPSMTSSVHTWTSGTALSKKVVTVSFMNDRVQSKAKAGF